MKCPFCNDEYLVICCWVATATEAKDKCTSLQGVAVETTCSDMAPPSAEPAQLAFCGSCGAYMAPPEGWSFQVHPVTNVPMLSADGQKVECEVDKKMTDFWPTEECDECSDSLPGMCPRCFGSGLAPVLPEII